MGWDVTIIVWWRQDDDNIAPPVGMRKREIEKRRPEQEQHRVMGNIEMNFVAYALTSDNILAPWSVGDSSAMFSKRFGW